MKMDAFRNATGRYVTNKNVKGYEIMQNRAVNANIFSQTNS